ncbi:UNVERIFIED_CONTAM: hypothetical protein K2H54_039537 [Gekko kuhli]
MCAPPGFHTRLSLLLPDSQGQRQPSGPMVGELLRLQGQDSPDRQAREEAHSKTRHQYFFHTFPQATQEQRSGVAVSPTPRTQGAVYSVLPPGLAPHGNQTVIWHAKRHGCSPHCLPSRPQQVEVTNRKPAVPLRVAFFLF